MTVFIPMWLIWIGRGLFYLFVAFGAIAWYFIWSPEIKGLIDALRRRTSTPVVSRGVSFGLSFDMTTEEFDLKCAESATRWPHKCPNSDRPSIHEKTQEHFFTRVHEPCAWECFGCGAKFDKDGYVEGKKSE